MANSVASKDKPKLMKELQEIFPVEQRGFSMVVQFEKFCNFFKHWSIRYPSFRRFKAKRNVAYFPYLGYPEEFHRMIYTTNWIERLNRFYKRVLKMRGAMPSADAVRFLLGRVALKKTLSTYSRAIPRFKEWDALRERRNLKTGI